MLKVQSDVFFKMKMREKQTHEWINIKILPNT